MTVNQCTNCHSVNLTTLCVVDNCITYKCRNCGNIFNKRAKKDEQHTHNAEINDLTATEGAI